MKRPIIGITIFQEKRPAGYYLSLSQDYVTSIISAGGIPVLIPFMSTKDIAGFIKDTGINGLLFTGGADLAPDMYGANPILAVERIEPRRDAMETELFSIAMKENMPILGICRGLQIINVLLGGSLYQHIDSQVKNANNHHPTGVERDTLFHSVRLEKDSLLYDIYKKDIINTNSFHHQAIKELSPQLRATGYSSDGIIEAFEYKDLDEHFVIGVQWHPENLSSHYNGSLEIFKLLTGSVK